MGPFFITNISNEVECLEQELYKSQMANLRQTLYAWRDNEASKRAVELFRILPNTAIDDIVRALPRTKVELTAIKGIKDAKWNAFGKQLLALIDEHVNAPTISVREKAPDDMRSIGSIQGMITGETQQEEESSFSVSAYLDIINNALWRMSARVKGEVTSFKIQGSAVYMGIRDTQDESNMSVFMWLSDYQLSGVEVTEGLEVIVEGKSEIYKPNGRFNFRASTIELVGEGALKKAYDELKKKLELEGIFNDNRKRKLPEFPERIALVTSKQGAVIHDFLNNLGTYGYKVRHTDARVEGVAAVKEILAAIRYFKEKGKNNEIDVLVIIRGGGSLESLQAFNHELVVRAIAEFPQPVICAIGHDKDVPLAQLAADHAPSTPTAGAHLLNETWDELLAELNLTESKMLSAVESSLYAHASELKDAQILLSDHFTRMYGMFKEVADQVLGYIPLLRERLSQMGKDARAEYESLSQRYTRALADISEFLRKLSTELETHNPMRQLKLGYSILFSGGKVLKRVEDAQKGTHFEAKLSDGTLEATITNITKIKPLS